MKISTKLIVFFCGVVTLFVVLALALLEQTRTVSAGYDALLAQEVRQAEAARVVQINFKKQVQEWKDTLLRGKDPQKLDHYWSAFQKREHTVDELAATLEKIATTHGNAVYRGDLAEAMVADAARHGAAHALADFAEHAVDHHCHQF